MKVGSLDAAGNFKKEMYWAKNPETAGRGTRAKISLFAFKLKYRYGPYYLVEAKLDFNDQLI